MRKTFKFLPTMAVLCLISACASQKSNWGNEFSMATADSFQPGVTTQQEAIAKLGPPESIQSAPNRGHRVAWQYVKSSASAGVGYVRGASIHEGIAIIFNAGGLMDHVDKRIQSTGRTTN